MFDYYHKDLGNVSNMLGKTINHLDRKNLGRPLHIRTLIKGPYEAWTASLTMSHNERFVARSISMVYCAGAVDDVLLIDRRAQHSSWSMARPQSQRLTPRRAARSGA